MRDRFRTRRTPRRTHRHLVPAEALESRTLLTALSLVRDLNTTNLGSGPHNFVASGGTLFFAAHDSEHGVELWATDGTAGRTRLVKDIDPRPPYTGFMQGNSSPTSLVDAGGTLLFFADDGQHGPELWKSDGTTDGTVMVRDINPGPEGSNAFPMLSQPMAVLNGVAYFTANETGVGRKLWRSDGTVAGTYPVSDVLFAAPPAELFAANGLVYFGRPTPLNGTEPWVSDGTAAGTRMLKDAGVIPWDPRGFLAVGPYVYLLGTAPREITDGKTVAIWRTDGTGAGTILIGRFTGASLGAVGSTLYVGTTELKLGGGFWGHRGALWKLAAGDTVLQKVADFPDLQGPTIPNLPSNLTEVNGRLVFSAYTAANGTELWQTDGTPGGTGLLADFVPGPGSGFRGEIRNANGALYFTAGNAVSSDGTLLNQQAYRSDGTPQGTVPLGLSGGGFTGYGSRVYFSGVPAPAIDGWGELWSTDGTAAGTGLLRDLNRANDGAVGVTPDVSGGKFFFHGLTAEHGSEPYVTDGTSAGTVLLKDIVPGPGDAQAGGFTSAGATTFFWTRYGRDLWRTDGTPDGTTLVKADAAPHPEDLQRTNLPGWIVAGSGVFYFTGVDSEHGVELWKSDGTAAGTTLVKDIRPGTVGSDIFFLGTTGSDVLFWADDGVQRELWRTDGTAAGTVIVSDLNGVARSSEASRFGRGFAFNGSVYFQSMNPDYRAVPMWRSDGTAAGTVRLLDYSGNVFYYAPLGDRLYFLDDTFLFRTDGTPAGTEYVQLDLGPGGVPKLQNLRAAGGWLYFSASVGGKYGFYRSDGTQAGTVRLADGTGSQPVAFGGKVYFINDGSADGIHLATGQELWETDGTAAGTHIVQDLNPGPATGVFGLNTNGNVLLMNATDGVHGLELWRVDPVDPPPASVVGRYAFYNGSSLDARDRAANGADDAAIATDKHALLPGQSATFANVTSYDRGLNGVIIDVAGLPPGQALAPGDFDFGGDAAGPPASVSVRRGAGVDGSDRVTLVWSDYNPLTLPATMAVGNGWLRVTVKANAHTGLATPDVFSFGNLIGETGDGGGASGWRVSALDLGRVKRDLNTRAAIDSVSDFNRDGSVNALDLGILKRAINRALAAPGSSSATPSPQSSPVPSSLLLPSAPTDETQSTASLRDSRPLLA